MAKRRRRKTRGHDVAGSIGTALPVALGVLAVALLVRFLLVSDGLAFGATARMALAVESSAHVWPVPSHDLSPDVVSHAGLVALARALYAVGREWMGASSATGTLQAMSIAGSALAAAALVWVAALMGMGRARAGLAGLCIALAPTHIAAGASGDPSGLAWTFATLAIGVAIVAGRRCSIGAAVLAGLLATLALAGTATALVAALTCAFSLVTAMERRGRLLLAFLGGVLPGLLLAVPMTLALMVHLTATRAHTSPFAGVGDVVGWLSPVGPLVLLAGAVIAVASGRRALALVWLAGTLMIDLPQDPELASIWTMPAALLLASAAVERWQRALVPLVGAGVIAAFAGGFETLAYRHDRVGPVITAERIAALTRPDALVVSPEPAYVTLYAERETRGWAAEEEPLGADRAVVRAITAGLRGRVEAGRQAVVLRSCFLAPGGAVLEGALRDAFTMEPLERFESEAPHRRIRRLSLIDETIYMLRPIARSGPGENAR